VERLVKFCLYPTVLGNAQTVGQIHTEFTRSSAVAMILE